MTRIFPSLKLAVYLLIGIIAIAAISPVSASDTTDGDNDTQIAAPASPPDSMQPTASEQRADDPAVTNVSSADPGLSSSAEEDAAVASLEIPAAVSEDTDPHAVTSPVEAVVRENRSVLSPGSGYSSPSYAVCFGANCSAGAGSNKPTYLTDPHPLSAANSSIPILSIKQLSYTEWVSTLGILGSNNPADFRSIIVDKAGDDPNQPISFVITTGTWGNDPGTNVVLTALANLTSTNAVLHYSAIATATQQLPTFSITPRIWRQEPSGDVLVYTGAPSTCSATDTCSISGDFTPQWDFANVTGTFFANVTTVYTMPVSLTGVGQGNDKVATIYPTGSNEPVPEVVVTGPLSPVPLGTTVPATNANNSVPWGGTIEHVMNGAVPTTIVYDSSGQPQYRADDREAENFITP